MGMITAELLRRELLGLVVVTKIFAGNAQSFENQ
jgi:hypothetical protein